MDWMFLPLRRYAEFSGRSRRLEYWMFSLMQFIVYTLLLGWAIFSGAFLEGGIHAVIVLLIGWWLGMLVPTLAVTVRRFHDQELTGWFVLITLVPWIGGIAILVFMCLPGTSGNNRYGADPKAEESLASNSNSFETRRLSKPLVQNLNISGFDGRGHVIRYAIDPESFGLHDFALKIGRSPASDLVIDDSAVSRDHAQIVLLEDGFYIRDLGSTNGTCINGEKLTPFEASKICSGDSLTFGKLEFLL